MLYKEQSISSTNKKYSVEKIEVGRFIKVFWPKLLEKAKIVK